MPDMDVFKLLELVGLEMDLPVIMLSTHGDTELVMKGITHGACDSLLKPAVPKKVLDLMNVEGLKRETVASHIQKYRLYIGHSIVAALGSKDPSYFRMGPLDGFGYFHTLTGPGRISSASLPSYQPGGMFGRLNSSAALSLHGISSSVIQPGHCQTSNNPINGSGKIQPAVVPANQ
ncbi:hypothetical protein Goarm_023338, partial [Gossypium armourianum]|nr:hypothetical protein [Gossypium armourianum]